MYRKIYFLFLRSKDFCFQKIDEKIKEGKIIISEKPKKNKISVNNIFYYLFFLVYNINKYNDIY